ncbi:Hsp20/alpha crystallin family protein [Lacticaseibacillus pabuli]|uniref:Hsp20/alpha crystallin family protein n=1 Tax=Lacticaseibacillus pabuli TaxID=3025672 RepID=A0ABY7WZK3_9LACO|nr:Hsp20/alpha crystallin family protein [Lacticaseibacillus sp. KACC 23028]WDF83320.1 Hsp20/alpha crystallin family protein [Lacticaseibacillus sp. KACC 23028]
MANNDIMSRRNNLDDPFFSELGRRFFGPASSWFDDMDNGISTTAMNGLPTDVQENKDNYTIKVDVPGIDKKNIKLSYKDKLLTISVNKKDISDHTDKDGNLLMSERSYGSASRSYELPNVDAKNIKAAADNGVLTITLPKMTEIQDADHNIEIN